MNFHLDQPLRRMPCVQSVLLDFHVASHLLPLKAQLTCDYVNVRHIAHAILPGADLPGGTRCPVYMLDS